jgi:hypothetical protein
MWKFATPRVASYLLFVTQFTASILTFSISSLQVTLQHNLGTALRLAHILHINYKFHYNTIYSSQTRILRFSYKLQNIKHYSLSVTVTSYKMYSITPSLFQLQEPILRHLNLQLQRQRF